jgi:hypothetical protein
MRKQSAMPETPVRRAWRKAGPAPGNTEKIE